MESFFRLQAIGANKRSRTRSVLLDSAVQVFSAKGFEEAKISDIAAFAGLANGTFYNHFKDKDELAAATAGAIALEIAKQLDQRMADLDQGLSRVVAASFAFLRLASLHEPWGTVLLEQFQRRPEAAVAAIAYMRADVQRAIDQRDLDVVLDDFLLSQLGAVMMVALRGQLNEGFDALMLHRTCENMLRMLGLTPKQARREVERVAQHELLSADLTFDSILSD